MPSVTATGIELQLSVKQMAEIFWSMSSMGQAEFFRELAMVIRKDHEQNRSAYSLGELQWFYVAEELSQPARDVLMCMAAPLYQHTLRYTERNP